MLEREPNAPTKTYRLYRKHAKMKCRKELRAQLKRIPLSEINFAAFSASSSALSQSKGEVKIWYRSTSDRKKNLFLNGEHCLRG
jgi:hypothetical protein